MNAGRHGPRLPTPVVIPDDMRGWHTRRDLPHPATTGCHGGMVARALIAAMRVSSRHAI
jgi:hypothetical protein